MARAEESDVALLELNGHHSVCSKSAYNLKQTTVIQEPASSSFTQPVYNW